MACAMVTDAGTPYLRWAATAAGATAPMKACWALVPCPGPAVGWSYRRYGEATGAAGWAERRCAIIGSPGMAAVSAIGACAHPPAPGRPVPGSPALAMAEGPASLRSCGRWDR